jgi:hypothetical protein
MCGQRTLQRRSISLSDLAAAMFSPIEHSVNSKYLGALVCSTYLIMALVPPEKSEGSTTSGLHSGCARITKSGNCFLMLVLSPTLHL